jgi:hypothetical protein
MCRPAAAHCHDGFRRADHDRRPDNGFEGVRFLYPVYEGLVLWDLSRRQARGDPPASPTLGTDREDKTKWICAEVFHDGSEFNAGGDLGSTGTSSDAPQFDPTGGAIARGRNPWLKSYRKIDDNTIEMTNARSAISGARLYVY